MKAQKLVRARPKAMEFMPEWAKCCEGMIAEIVECGEIVVDIGCVTKSPTGYGKCRHCGKLADCGPFVEIAGRDTRSPIALLDLDEGPLEAQRQEVDGK